LRSREFELKNGLKKCILGVILNKKTTEDGVNISSKGKRTSVESTKRGRKPSMVGPCVSSMIFPEEITKNTKGGRGRKKVQWEINERIGRERA